jgi:nitrous oxidase accessory protein NosD
MAATSLLSADEEVSGTVTTPEGQPIAGAVVASEAGRLTHTDEEGRYTLSVPPGEQPVAAVVVGRETAVETIDPASTDTKQFELEAATEAQAELRDPMSTRIDPGGVATADFETAGAETITVEAETAGPLSPDALSLRIDGKPVEFGEPFEVQDDWRRGVSVEIEADGEAPPGSVRPHVAFEGGGETVSGRLDTLYVHSNPFRVGPDFPVGLQEPIHLFAPGTTIVLENGTYEATGGGPAPLVVDRPVSLVAAEGAEPTLVAGSDSEAGVLVTGNDVELRGLRIEADGAAAGVQVGTRETGSETEAPSGVTVADNEVVGATDGVVTFGAPALWIERNRIEATGNGTRIAGPQRATVRENEITGAAVGVAIEGMIPGVSNNRIADAETGILLDVPTRAIEALGGGFGTIEANTVENADEGIRIVDAAPDGSVGDNSFRNVDTEQVGSTGGVAAATDAEDSPLGVVLYGSAALTVALLFVPYGLRRFRRR